MKRLLVTGSRSWEDTAAVVRVLDGILTNWGALTVVHGGARGADQIAAAWAARRAPWVAAECWDPDWAVCGGPECTPQHRKVNSGGQEFCPTAGLRRNTAMCQSRIDFAVAFHMGASAGTAHCVRQIHRAGIPGVLYPEGMPL